MVVTPKDDTLLKKYLFLILKNSDLSQVVTGAAQPQITRTNLEPFHIPLPPKDIQEKIINEIETLEILEKESKEKIEIFKNEIFTVIKKNSISGRILDLCTISKRKIEPQSYKEKEFVYLGLEHIESNTGKLISKNIEFGGNIQSSKSCFVKSNILYGKLRPYLNKVVIADCDGICSTDILVLESKVPLLLKYILLSKEFVDEATLLMAGISLPRIRVESFLNIEVPIPQEQQEIVKQIEEIENKIQNIEKKLKILPIKKEEIFEKYL